MCTSPGTAAAPEAPPRPEEPLSTGRRLLPDLLRLARLAFRIAKLAKLLLQPADEVGASADSIRLSSSSMEACRDEGEMVRGEGVGVGVLSAPEAAGTSTTVVLQPSLRCSGIMLKIAFLLPKQLLRRCGRLAAIGCDAAGCFTPWCSSTIRARAQA